MTYEEARRFHLCCMLAYARDREIYRFMLGRPADSPWTHPNRAHREAGFLETLLELAVSGYLRFEADEHGRVTYILPTESGLRFLAENGEGQ